MSKFVYVFCFLYLSACVTTSEKNQIESAQEASVELAPSHPDAIHIEDEDTEDVIIVNQDEIDADTVDALDPVIVEKELPPAVDLKVYRTQKKATLPLVVKSAPTSQLRVVKDGLNDLLSVPEASKHRVEKWLDYFQNRGRRSMEVYLSRFKRYQKYMSDILIKEEVPEELIFVSLIESGFSSRAKSWASAVGYWQFIRGTGKAYGLAINSSVDERQDPKLSTQAAAQYFKALYQVFGTWPLALASYNAGEHRVMRSVMKNLSSDFWILADKKQLPQETRNYVPKFIAAATIAQNPSAYGFSDVAPEAELAYDEILLKKGISLKKLAKNMNVELSLLKRLNPIFKTDYAPNYKAQTYIRVPQGTYTTAESVLAQSEVSKTYNPYSGNRYHRVRRGENLSLIAAKYRLGLSKLMRLNGLSGRSILRPGMKIKLPGGRNTSSAVAKSKSAKKYHRIKRGDTLSSIARKYGMRISALAKKNKMKYNGKIYVGQLLKIK